MRKYYLIICLLLTITLISCTDSASPKGDDGNSIYYWRTTFSLNDSEKEFIRKHDVRKIYMRFFDVDWTYPAKNGERVIPEATIRFNDTVPADINVVPTIYITTSAMEEMQMKEDEYAEKIYKRINAICKQNNIVFNEIQLDCDWTKGTYKRVDAMINDAITEFTDPEKAARVQLEMMNYATLMRRYPCSKAAAQIRSRCDNYHDYALQKR